MAGVLPDVGGAGGGRERLIGFGAARAIGGVVGVAGGERAGDVVAAVGGGGRIRTDIEADDGVGLIDVGFPGGGTALSGVAERKAAGNIVAAALGGGEGTK